MTIRVLPMVIFLCLGLVLTSCSKNRGCTNEWASNFDPDAEKDCCCEFEVPRILKEIEGQHQFKEECSDQNDAYNINIKTNPNEDNGILIENFNNSGKTIAASWNYGEFALQKEWEYNGCEVELTGSLHRAENKIFIIYAAIEKDNCNPGFSSMTCEGRTY